MTFGAVGVPDTVPVSWPPAPSGIFLGANAVHVWCAPLDNLHGVLSRFYALLSSEERIHARKFHVAVDRDRFIARRGILRELLALYLDQTAETIEFFAGPFGKPGLARPDRIPGLHFNASHSGALALYAVSSGSPVGVDVERLREIPELGDIASRFFGADEASRLTALPPGERLDEFFAVWTANEAFLKATGIGIAAQPGVRSVAPMSVPSDWRLRRLMPAAGYIGALACRHDAAVASSWCVPGAIVQAREC